MENKIKTEIWDILTDLVMEDVSKGDAHERICALFPKKEYNGLPSDEYSEHIKGLQVHKDGLQSALIKNLQSEIEALKVEIAELKKENDLFKAVAVEVANYSTSKTSALQLKKLAESVLTK